MLRPGWVQDALHEEDRVDRLPDWLDFAAKGCSLRAGLEAAQRQVGNETVVGFGSGFSGEAAGEAGLEFEEFGRGVGDGGDEAGWGFAEGEGGEGLDLQLEGRDAGRGS